MQHISGFSKSRNFLFYLVLMYPYFESLESYQEIYKKSIELPDIFW